jgi:hypothetical protein
MKEPCSRPRGYRAIGPANRVRAEQPWGAFTIAADRDLDLVSGIAADFKKLSVLAKRKKGPRRFTHDPYAAG